MAGSGFWRGRTGGYAAGVAFAVLGAQFLIAGAADGAASIDQGTPKAALMHYGPGESQKYFAWLPPHPTTRFAVVTVHGGSWVRGSARRMDPLNRRLYALGIPSFSIDYRKAGTDPWPAQRQDVTAALTMLQKNAPTWRIDPFRLALIGSSAGGHLALDLASRQGTDLTCAAVAYSAPTSIKLVRDQADDGRLQRSLAKATLSLAPKARAVKDASLPRTPSLYDAPALLFAGSEEWVTAQHTKRFAKAYSRVNPDVRAVVLEGETRHALGYVFRGTDVWEETLAFIREFC